MNQKTKLESLALLSDLIQTLGFLASTIAITYLVVIGPDDWPDWLKTALAFLMVACVIDKYSARSKIVILTILFLLGASNSFIWFENNLPILVRIGLMVVSATTLFFLALTVKLSKFIKKPANEDAKWTKGYFDRSAGSEK